MNCASISFINARFSGVSVLPGPYHADQLIPISAHCRVIDSTECFGSIISRLRDTLTVRRL
ncbi:hypothetical protein [Alloyangia pacifica]|uniref:hypothetical protein n=1 Tax=Alloyangia pacifica TaxID=311180 RepID=UPI002671D48F|nr:hypothetical protein [Alloyangia pacifica]